MKAISLWEPWATLVMTGEKQYETRYYRFDGLRWIEIDDSEVVEKSSKK